MLTCIRFQVTYFTENVHAKQDVVAVAGAALYQLVEYRQLDIKVYLMTKHALTFFKSDRFLGKDKMKTP